MPMEELSVMERIEARRVEQGLTQAEVARACGLTQGHYSKLAKGMHQPGRRVGAALESWLAPTHPSGSGVLQAMRMASLAASIREDCAELIRLARSRGVQQRGTSQ